MLGAQSVDSGKISLNNNTHVICRFVDTGTVISFWSDGFTVNSDKYVVEMSSDQASVYCPGLSLSGKVEQTITLADNEENIIDFLRQNLPPSCDGKCRAVADLLIAHSRLGICHANLLHAYSNTIEQLLVARLTKPVQSGKTEMSLKEGQVTHSQTHVLTYT